MGRLLFRVDETFQIRDRGLVLAPGVGPDVACRVRDELELRRPDGTTLRTRVVGIEILGPNPSGQMVILLPPDVSKTDVPAATEVWLVRNK